MHVRVTTTRRGSKTYRYVQLVQSYRREDGTPAHKVLASLGKLSELETQNLREAIAASRNGQAVVVPKELAPLKVKRNLAYLDVAACYRTWLEWELSQLIDELAPIGKRDVGLGEVIAALTVQRCVAPASKLQASRWYPRTALPELQGISPGQFNNTRIHRALEVLDEIEAPLQRRLAQRVEAREGRFGCLFLDCTDTWFEGCGPNLAQLRTTKEGLLRVRIGIALTCDQRGFPLRWATLPGDHHEADTMIKMLDQLVKLGWSHEVPLVVDRAMGNGVTIEAMLARDVRFITAVPAPEIAGYSTRIPLGSFDEVALGDSDRKNAKVLDQLRETALEAGFEEVSPKRYVLDLGEFTKGEGQSPKSASWLKPSRARATLLVAQRIRAELDAGVTAAALASQYKSSERQQRRWLELLHLSDEIQERILAGEADRIPPEILRGIARRPVEEQATEFEHALHEAGEGPALVVSHRIAHIVGLIPLRVRAVVLFNPEQFIEQRQTATDAERKLQALCHDINHSLRSPRSQRSRTAAMRKISEAISKRSMLDVFDVESEEVDVDGRTVHQVRLVKNDEAWKRRRHLDGINLIVAHPQVSMSAQELVALYFAKDKVEKDFQAIKSVLALRPVHHRTDLKVRAHVSLCMLALLLERALEQRLHNKGLHLTAAAALHELSSGHLNVFGADPALYSVTEPTAEQQRILTALDLQDLTDDELTAQNLTHR